MNLGGSHVIPLAEIRRAREVIATAIIRTPTVRLNFPESPAQIYLKLENLQPIGSFKIRGAANAMRQVQPETLAKGVITASAGNMAQGVAWNARELGIPCTVIVPESAPATKVAAIERLGGKVVKVPFDRWWQTIVDHRFEGIEGVFIHPIENDLVMAGNGTIGLEILEDVPDVSVVLIPWGGGGLSIGIASAIRALKPDTKIYAIEVETATPLSSSLAAGSAQVVTHRASFVDGIAARSLLPKMLPLAQELLDGVLVTSIEETASAVRLLAERNRVIAEGAGAAPVAVALAGQAGTGKIVCVVSGGNIDFATLTTILAGETPPY
jgi:threonine dehydratase